MLVQNIIFFILSSLALIVSGVYLVKSLSKISRFLGISEFSTAFIIMAFATSIPELFVGVSSALSNNSALSLGNIIGANILNLTLVAGIIIILGKEIKFKTKSIGKDTYLMLIAITLVIVLFVIGKSLSKIDGLILLGFFAFHVYNVFKKRKKYSKKLESDRHKKNRFLWLLIFMMSLVVLFVSSQYVVRYASNIAVELNFPEIIVGLFLLSIATTLPELVFGVTAANTKHKEMAIGNTIGTTIVNSTFILGIVAVINPIKADFMPFLISGAFMFIAAFLLVTFIKSGRKLERFEGISLILLYVLFIIFEIFIKN
ncbi:sodium:calcium antiporter [Candidatus Pacearchaeota archaeon]|nr:sodium:calcium antiporter [Candidatus Pacearchaeota archaeon]